MFLRGWWIPQKERFGMTAPLTSVIGFKAESRPELETAIARQMTAWGWTCHREEAPMITVASLARQVGRGVASVSRSLHRASAPPFDAIYGRGLKRRRILKIRATAELLEYLKTTEL